jgi:hypothetical protein
MILQLQLKCVWTLVLFHYFHTRTSKMRRLFSLVAMLALLASAHQVRADIVSYYVGIDANPGLTGTYAAHPNTNQDRLTLLFHHGNHYHGIGTYSYSGDPVTPTTNDTNANNRIPEIYTGMLPLSLRPGSGAWAGTFRSGLPSSAEQDLEYGNLEFRSVHSLSSEDPTTYNSSSGRWNDPFDAAHIHLELVSKSPGLKVAFGVTPVDQLANPGDDWHMGDGDELFSITPIFWVDDTATVGSTYYAEFKLTDDSGAFGDSGRFYFDFQAVPEPASAAILGAAAIGLVGLRRRLKSRC